MPPIPGYDLLIVSDLHLSEGRNPKTRKVSLNEDFFFDEEFARFLRHHDSHRGPQHRWHLIINGDFMDFLQVTSPISDEYDQDFLHYMNVQTGAQALTALGYASYSDKYGFGSTEKETVYKLLKIMNGHWLFFEAMAEFLLAGNIVSIGRGNHDVEFIYDGVKEQFRTKLQRIYEDKLHRENKNIQSDLKKYFADTVHFIDWFHYEPGVIWVEHGNQYDEVNCFRYWLAPYLPKSNPKLIELPWGSFFVRYLFNLIELEEPFADNIKPQNRFILWFITRKTKLALRFLFGDGKRMLSRIRRAWTNVPEADPQFVNEHQQRRDKLADEFGLNRSDVSGLDEPPFRCESVLVKPDGGWRLVRMATLLWPLVLAFLALLLVAGLADVIWIVFSLLLPILPSQLAKIWTAVAEIPISVKLADVIRWACLCIFSPLLVLYLVIRFKRLPPQKFSGLADRACQISQVMNVPYVTMGHTHEVDLRIFKDKPNQPQYFNTGTWTKVFGDDADRLLREESELIFLQVTGDKKDAIAKLMKWDDGANEPRLVMLFDKSGD